MSYRSKVAIVYLLGFFVDLINMFIANVAYPAIGQAMRASVSQLAWVEMCAGLSLTQRTHQIDAQVATEALNELALSGRATENSPSTKT